MALSIVTLMFLPAKRKVSKPKTTNNIQIAERVVF